MVTMIVNNSNAPNILDKISFQLSHIKGVQKLHGDHLGCTQY